GGVIGPRLSFLARLRLSVPSLWLRNPILLGVALLLVRYVAGLRLSQIGFHRWREWNGIERSYFLQILPMATVVFSILFAGRLRMIIGEPSLWGRAAVALLTYFTWGVYQEVVYR